MVTKCWECMELSFLNSKGIKMINFIGLCKKIIINLQRFKAKIYIGKIINIMQKTMRWNYLIRQVLLVRMILSKKIESKKLMFMIFHKSQHRLISGSKATKSEIQIFRKIGILLLNGLKRKKIISVMDKIEWIEHLIKLWVMLSKMRHRDTKVPGLQRIL